MGKAFKFKFLTKFRVKFLLVKSNLVALLAYNLRQEHLGELTDEWRISLLPPPPPSPAAPRPILDDVAFFGFVNKEKWFYSGKWCKLDSLLVVSWYFRLGQELCSWSGIVVFISVACSRLSVIGDDERVGEKTTEDYKFSLARCFSSSPFFFSFLSSPTTKSLEKNYYLIIGN